MPVMAVSAASPVIWMNQSVLTIVKNTDERTSADTPELRTASLSNMLMVDMSNPRLELVTGPEAMDDGLTSSSRFVF